MMKSSETSAKTTNVHQNQSTLNSLRNYLKSNKLTTGTQNSHSNKK